MSGRSSFVCFVAALLLSLVTRGAGAQDKLGQKESVPVKVVDGSDDHAFIEPGSSAGVAVGDEVRIGSDRYRVSAVSSSFAVVSLGGKPLPLGARGTAFVPKRRDRIELDRKVPTPLAQFRGEWQPPVTPASAQTPAPVPLGSRAARGHSKSRLILSDGVFGVVPTRDQPAFVTNELRGRLHYEPYAATPLALDLDLGLQTFGGRDFGSRPGAAARQLLRIREASMTYGTMTGFRAALGRLRAAGSVVGQLDGLRIEAPLGSGFRVSAYGGTLPQPFNGMLSLQASRFGSELTYEDADADWRPRLVAGAYASRFDGGLDERRAYASFDVLPADSRFGGQAQVSFHDPDNPWRASTVELTMAGLEAETETGPFHVGARAQLRRPDRSRFLAAVLPPEWLCWSSPERANAACRGRDATYSWQLDGGVRAGKLSVDIGGQSAFTIGTDASNFGGFANLRWLDLVGRIHLDAGMSVMNGSVVRSASALLAPGVVFAGGHGDISVHYQPALVRYRATLRSGLEHSVGSDLWLAPTDELDLNLGGDWVKADQLNVFLLQATAIWKLDF